MLNIASRVYTLRADFSFVQIFRRTEVKVVSLNNTKLINERSAPCERIKNLYDTVYESVENKRIRFRSLTNSESLDEGKRAKFLVNWNRQRDSGRFSNDRHAENLAQIRRNI